MPILVRASELEPGMCLAGNILNSYSVLLPYGHILTERDVTSLARLIPDEMVQVIDPLLDQIVDFQDDSQDQQVSKEVRANVAIVVGNVSSRIRSGVHLAAENIVGMQKVIDEMLRYLQENPVTMALIEQSSGWSSYLQQHSANVFYLSLVIGNTIRNYIKNERERLSAAPYIQNAMNLAPLATAALFHDIGMVPLEYLYQKNAPLTQQEKQLVRNHPTAGSEMLPDEIEPLVKLIIRSHHENHNGSGYPEGISGDKICIFARIIRVADAYAAAVSHKTYQESKSSATALYEMLHGGYQHFYDPVILKVLSTIVPPFPLGAKLKLQNSQWAVVVRHNYKDPFKPQIIIAFDELGDPFSKEQLESPFYLGDRKYIKIQSFAGEDLSFLNDFICRIPVQEEKPDTLTYSNLFDFAYP